MPQQYPNTLLPKKDYKFIDCDVSENYLVRYVDRISEDESIVDELGKVLVEHIGTPRERIQDLSVSLLGIYKKAHTELKFNKSGAEYSNYCEPDEEVQSPIHLEHFDSDKLRSFWVIQIKNIVGKKVTVNLDNVDKQAVSYVQHTPTKGNFWHYSVRWSIDGKNIFDMDKKVELKIAKKIGAIARAIFIQFAEIDVEDNDGLTENCYRTA